MDVKLINLFMGIKLSFYLDIRELEDYYYIIEKKVSK